MEQGSVPMKTLNSATLKIPGLVQDFWPYQSVIWAEL